MSRPMDAEEYQQEALKLERQHRQSRLNHAVLGLAGEVGELASLVKSTTDVDPLQVLDECGDAIWYLTLALDSVGQSLDMAMRWNLVKLTRRSAYGKNRQGEAALLQQMAPKGDGK